MILDKQIPVGTAEDLTNKKFGKLTVLKRVENDRFNQVRYKCKCDCGNEKEVSASHDDACCCG